jgi:hypothetical protein
VKLAVVRGGMLARGEGLLHELVVAELPDGARAVTPALPPVGGAVLAALDPRAGARFREAFRGWEPRG